MSLSMNAMQVLEALVELEDKGLITGAKYYPLEGGMQASEDGTVTFEGRELLKAKPAPRNEGGV